MDLKAPEMAIGLEEDLLNRLLGLVGIAEHSQRQGVHGGCVAFDDAVKSPTLASQGALNGEQILGIRRPSGGLPLRVLHVTSSLLTWLRAHPDIYCTGTVRVSRGTRRGTASGYRLSACRRAL